MWVRQTGLNVDMGHFEPMFPAGTATDQDPLVDIVQQADEIQTQAHVAMIKTLEKEILKRNHHMADLLGTDEGWLQDVLSYGIEGQVASMIAEVYHTLGPVQPNNPADLQQAFGGDTTNTGNPGGASGEQHVQGKGRTQHDDDQDVETQHINTEEPHGGAQKNQAQQVQKGPPERLTIERPLLDGSVCRVPVWDGSDDYRPLFFSPAQGVACHKEDWREVEVQGATYVIPAKLYQLTEAERFNLSDATAAYIADLMRSKLPADAPDPVKTEMISRLLTYNVRVKLPPQALWRHMEGKGSRDILTLVVLSAIISGIQALETSFMGKLDNANVPRSRQRAERVCEISQQFDATRFPGRG